jgi:putative hydrolase of the HAD superfamily
VALCGQAPNLSNYVIRAFLFDLDGTLFDRDAAVAGILAWQVRMFRDVIAPEQAVTFCHRVTVLDAHGHRDKREVYATVATEFGFDTAVTEQLIASFWAEYPRHCRLDAGVAATLAELRRRGSRLGIVTNGTASVQNATLDALGVRDAVDAVLVSETEGVRKPDAAIFHRAAERLGVRPDECCFVGDHPTVDIAGAEAAGLRAVWRRTPYWVPAAPVPTTIDAIPELLSLALS